MNKICTIHKSSEDETQWILEAQLGSEEAAERIAEKYRGLIIKLSHRFYIGTQGVFSREELIQAGYVGLFNAMAHYVPQKGASLGTYAFSWILGEMRKALKTSVNHMGNYEGVLQIRRFQEEFEAAHGREATIMEIAQGCAMPCWQTASLMNHCIESHTEDIVEGVACQTDSCRKELHEIVEWNMALEQLETQERRLILLRYFRGLSQKETANLLGKSQAQVSRMERQAIERLKAQLTE